jgi:hypothetical protein
MPDDDPETVEVGKYNTRNDVFHTRDCKRKPDDTTTWLRNVAEEQGLRECKYCSGEGTASKQPNRDIFQAAIEYDPENA